MRNSLQIIGIIILATQLPSCLLKKAQKPKSKKSENSHIVSFLKMLERRDRSVDHIRKCEIPLGKYFLASKEKSKTISNEVTLHEIRGYRVFGMMNFNQMEYIVNHLSVYIPENAYEEDLAALRLRLRAISRNHAIVLEFNFDEVGTAKNDQFSNLFDLNGSSRPLIKLKNFQSYLKNERNYHIEEIKLKKDCFTTYLITNNKQMLVSKTVIKSLVSSIKKIQKSLKRRRTPMNMGGAKALVSFAQSSSSAHHNRGDFQNTVFTILDKIVKTVNHKFFMTMRDIEIQKYRRLNVIIDKKGFGQTGLAQRLDKTQLNALVTQKAVAKTYKHQLISLAQNYVDSPSAQSALLRLKE